MPGFGSRGGVRRPNAQLFQVHRLPEKDSCTPGLKKDEDLQQPEGLDDLHEWIDNILEQNDDISGLLEEPAAGQPVKNFPALPPALLEHPSRHFYDSLVRCADDAPAPRPPPSGFPWRSGLPLCFVHCGGGDLDLEVSHPWGGKSNPDEAAWRLFLP